MSKSFVAVSVIAILLLLAVVLLFQSPGPRAVGQEISYSQLLSMGPKLRDVTIRGDELTGHDTENHVLSAMVPRDPTLPTRLAQGGTNVIIGPAATDNSSWITTLVINLVPLVVFYLMFALPMRRLAKAVEALAGRRRAETEPS